MDAQSLTRIKGLARQRQNRKNIRKSYLVKGSRRIRPLQFLRPELYAYAYQIEGIGDGSPTIVVSITNAGGAPSDNTVVKLFLPNRKVLKKRTSVQAGQTKTVAFEWSGSPLPTGKVSAYHLLCFDPLNDPISGRLTTEAVPQERNFVRGAFPDRPPLSLQIVNDTRMRQYLNGHLSQLGFIEYYQKVDEPQPIQYQISTLFVNKNDPKIPASISDAISSVQDFILSRWWKNPTTGYNLPLIKFFNWGEIESYYEHYSDLQGWTAHASLGNGFAAINSPNGWRAQDDEELSGVCIATTGLTQPTSELHQIVTMNSQTIGTAARSFLEQGDLLAALSATVKVEHDATIATLGLDCLDNAGAVLTTVRTSSPPASGQWYRVAASFALPPNTARVRLRLMCDKSAAADNNAVFGDLSLTFTHRQVYYGNLRT